MPGATLSTRIAEQIRTNLWAGVAVFIVLGGTASALPGKNKVDSGDIKNANVRLADLAANSVDSSKVTDNGLTGTDIDESTLALPATPTTLPPAGPAAGDLNGSYPGPQVREVGLTSGGDLSGAVSDAEVSEAGLATGGDLSGPLSNAQVTEAGLTTGGDLSGPLSSAQVAEAGLTTGGDLSGPLSSAQIAASSVGSNELVNGVNEAVIGADEIATNAADEAGEPDLGEQDGFPAVLFDGVTNETLDLLFLIPSDFAPGSGSLLPELWFSAPADGAVRWAMSLARVRPGTTDTLAGAGIIGTSADVYPIVNGRVVTTGPAPFTGTQPGDLIRLQITRDAAAANDDIAADAALLGVQVRFASTG